MYSGETDESILIRSDYKVVLDRHSWGRPRNGITDQYDENEMIHNVGYSGDTV